MKNKIEFSKKFLIVDYLIAIILLLYLCIAISANAKYIKETSDQLVESELSLAVESPYDINNIQIIIIAWISQLAISSCAYYWKAKAENLIKMPIILLENLPKDMRDRVDPTQVIESTLGRNPH